MDSTLAKNDKCLWLIRERRQSSGKAGFGDAIRRHVGHHCVALNAIIASLGRMIMLT